MSRDHKIFYETNYFNRGWTWIKRALITGLLAPAVILLPLDPEYQYGSILIAAVVVLFQAFRPVDDLIVTNLLLVHVRRSVIKKFTKSDEYKISELTSLRCGSIHDDGWEIIDFLNLGGDMGGYHNTVEMSFKDGSSNSLRLPIARSELDFIIKLVDKLKRKSEF